MRLNNGNIVKITYLGCILSVTHVDLCRIVDMRIDAPLQSQHHQSIAHVRIVISNRQLHPTNLEYDFGMFWLCMLLA